MFLLIRFCPAIHCMYHLSYQERGAQPLALLPYFTDTTLRKEGNILFNDALNTFYLRLYGVRHMVKDHSDSERGNLLQQGFFYMHHPTDMIIHTTAFVMPVVEHWLEREIAQWVHPMKDRSDTHHTMSEHSYHRATSRSSHTEEHVQPSQTFKLILS